MGTSDVAAGADERRMRAFTRAVLRDLDGLERLIERGSLESNVRRIGAEQEMFLIDGSRQPAPVAVQILEQLGHDPRLTTELARFNLEANLTPRPFGGDCLSKLEEELTDVIDSVDAAGAELGASVVLTGILPTLRQSHLTLDNMTPNPRYHELNRATELLRDGAFSIVIKGLDELDITHDNVMVESANTSFQIHFQVGPEEFAELYNLAQAISAPVLAAAVNSPILFGQRLWYETRVALFQRSVDVRSSTHKRRADAPRVSFGEAWIKDSILEIYRDDITRFRIMLSTGDLEEDPVKVIEEGRLPELRALRMHTSTVWRWNRACYGVADGKAHLRIENRVLPAGPTVVDEVANAAFFFGLMSSISVEHPRIDQVMDFDHAKNNFFSAARHGLDAQFRWIRGETFTARDLIVNELLPRARQGLVRRQIAQVDIDRYLGIIEERVEKQATGAQWALRSLANMRDAPSDVRLRSLTAAMDRNRRTGEPVHTWPLAELYRTRDWFPSYRTVGQFMSTELFTVRPTDPVELAARVMDWRELRHVPVEDHHGRLVGLLSFRSLLRLIAQRPAAEAAGAAPTGAGAGGGGPVGEGTEGTEGSTMVQDVMHSDPVTVTADTPTLPALELMRTHNVGCLPVVDDDRRLIGMVTASDLLGVAEKVLEDFLRDDESQRGALR